MEEKPETNKKPENTNDESEKKEEMQESEKIEETNEESKEDLQAESGEEVKDEPVKELKQGQPTKQTKKEEKPKDKREKSAKKSDYGEDFKYIVRIANTDINGEKNVIYGLTSIKGIGLHMAYLIADKTGINKYEKIGDLDDKKIETLQKAIDSINEDAPHWMVNHRKDLETGKDIHLVGSEIDMKLRDEINIMKKIRSYRGIRHERGLPVRGQRTRANNRKGLALGVSKKRAPTQTQ